MGFKGITELFDGNGNAVGAYVDAAAWEAVREAVLELLARHAPLQEERPEPLQDWETLKQYWDFPYPVDMDVACTVCGSSTEDWSKDEPRKFRLSTATLAGLVSFECRQCRARVMKKHFKSHIKTEVHPYLESKSDQKEARYR